jgi:hypothetical protein
MTSRTPTTASRAAVTVIGLCLAALAPTTLPAMEEPERIVVVGDVHGAFDEFVEMLQQADILDESLAWSGGETVLVQTGDFLDRGGDVREIMDLLMRLEQEAPQHGGRSITLLGNHEAMNLIGILRDVSPEAFASFTTEDSVKRQKKEWKRFTSFHASRARDEGTSIPFFDSGDRERWMEKHPPGWFEYRDALSADGEYGAWLRTLPVAVKMGRLFFVHGGLGPDMVQRTPEAINARVADELRRFDEAQLWLEEERLALPRVSLSDIAAIVRSILETGARAGMRNFEHAQALSDLNSWDLISSDGPLWYRGLARGDEATMAPVVAQLFAAEGIDHMVIAHTPQASGLIQSRFDDRVFLIDTGLHPGHFKAGRPSALEIAPEAIRALYLQSEATLVRRQERPVQVAQKVEPSPPRSNRYVFLDVDGNPSPHQRPEPIVRFLERSQIVDRQILTGGSNRPVKVVLDDGTVRLHGIFRDVDKPIRDKIDTLGTDLSLFRDRGVNEVAAYHVDQLLGIGRVPPATLREFGNRSGSLQIWMEGIVQEIDRRRDDVIPPDRAYWARQLVVMKVFDALIGNIDRNQGNMLFDQHWKLWLIDHTRAFHRGRRVPGLNELTRCDRRLYDALVELDDAAVRESLATVLDDRQVEALLQRKATLVEHFDGLIAEKGHLQVLFDLTSAEGASPLEDLPELLEIPATTPFAALETVQE